MVSGMDTHVDEQQGADQETGESKAVAYDFHGWTGRAKGRGGDVGAAVIVYDNTDGEVKGRHDGLADYQSTAIVDWITHLGGDGEECRRAGVCEDDGGERGDGVDERWMVDDLVVGHPDAWRCCGWTVLDTDGDSHD